MAHYRFITKWFFPVPIERVFAAIEDAEKWPTFWKGVVAVEVLARPAQGKLGTRTRNTWKSVLPYRLVFDAEVVAFDAPHRIEVNAFGELRGRGRCELREANAGTCVTYHWDVVTTRLWMNLLAPVLRPLFKWNHDAVMRWGYEGFRRQLRV